MIAGQFHDGSGLGNQLHRYVASRVLAEDKGVEHGMVDPEKFKGKEFMSINPTKANGLMAEPDVKYFHEKKVIMLDQNQQELDIRPYDPEVNFIQDNTIIDGEFQDERYFEHRIKEIDEWLKVEPLDMPDDLCVIGFRGGEFKVFPDLFLTKEYWDKAKLAMLLINPEMKFEVHTDDPETAKEAFPDYKVIHDIGLNWRSVRYAKNAIIANSSFYILPRLLSGGMTIAPRYWARRNTGVWALPQNYYKKFTHI